MPISLLFVSRKWRETASVFVSISTSISSIMQAEYCFAPFAVSREPCGIVQVGTAFDFDHPLGRYDRDGRRNHIAVQVEVDNVEQPAVGRDVHCRGKHSKPDLA